MTAGVGSAGLRLLDRARRALPPEGRRFVRRVTDPLLSKVGSVRAFATHEPVIGLTFDDGPDAIWTPQILDVLAAHGARATFFVLLDRADAHPSLVRRMLAEGHEVGLHGVDHRRLAGKPHTVVLHELMEGRRRLEALTGAPVTWLRPPFGAQSVASYRAARSAGLDVAVWAADAEDWVGQSAPECAERAASRLGPGKILLLHDAFAPPHGSDAPQPDLDRAGVLELLLTRLASESTTAHSLGELRDRFPVQRTAWFRA